MGRVPKMRLRMLFSVGFVALAGVLIGGFTAAPDRKSGQRVALRTIPVEAKTTMLQASDGKPRNGFGISVAVYGDTALIGSPFDDENGSRSGAVYIFVRDNNGVWTEQSKLVEDPPSRYFGLSIDVYDDTVFVGNAGLKEERGKVYVYTRDSTGAWNEQTKIQASDGEPDDQFGGAVAIDRRTAVISACRRPCESHSHYVFNRDSTGAWTETVKLQAARGDSFSAANAIDGDTILIGAKNDNQKGKDSGAAYIFVRDQNGLWTKQAKLKASDPARHVHFGAAVDLDGDTAVVGTKKPWKKRSNKYKGQAYVFARDSTGAWIERAKLLATDGTPRDGFGNTVAIDGDTILIGAKTDNDKGKVYLFTRNAGGEWISQAQLLPTNLASQDNFGSSLAVDGGTVVVGTWSIALGTEKPEGKAYVFTVDGDRGAPDYGGFRR